MKKFFSFRPFIDVLFCCLLMLVAILFLLKTEEENIFPIEDKVEEMQELCREYFDDFDYINEGFGEIDYGDGYEEFNSDGRITVDGEQIDMGDEWKVAYENTKVSPMNCG